MHRMALLLSFLLLLSGCLEFDGQEITVLHDAKVDRIDVHLVYRGFYASGRSDKRHDRVAEAAESLEADRRRGTVSIFSGWVALEPTKTAEQGNELVDHIDVETGPLFTDAQGLLCAEQFVRIRDARTFLEKFDATVKAALHSQNEANVSLRGKVQLDAESLRCFEDFCRTGERFLLVEPGRIEVRLPLSDRDHARLKNLLVETLAEDVTDVAAVGDSKAARREAVRRSTFVQLLASNEVSMVRETNLTRLAVGVKGAERLLLRRPCGGHNDPALLQHVVKNGASVERLTDADLEQRFTAFRARDAVLAPDLAAIRGTTKAQPPASTK